MSEVGTIAGIVQKSRDEHELGVLEKQKKDLLAGTVSEKESRGDRSEFFNGLPNLLLSLVSVCQ